MPAHSHLISTMQWIRKHWLNAVAITAWGTILLVVATAAPFAIRRWSRSGSKPAPGHLRRQREVMLRRVRYKWITGVLEPSLADAAHITLGLKRRLDVLEPGSRAILRINGPQESFPEGTSISEIFQQVGSELLIVGGPGAGKTTLLLQLADELLTRAESDPGQPIPVVFHLSSWASRRQPLEEWLARELAINYHVPARTASAWLAQDTLTLLLDGLDEVASVHRAECAAVINAYRRDHGLAPIAVCSRTEELDHLAVRLRLHEAVELQPPTDAEIDGYLGHLETTGTPLADVRATLTTDESLRELLRSPLMLHVITLAYHGRPAPALDNSGSTKERRAQLWGAYVARMFEQRPLEPSSSYTPAQAIRSLRWLARSLQDRDETEFHLYRLSYRWIPLLGGIDRRMPYTRQPAVEPPEWGGPFSGPVRVLILLAAVSAETAMVCAVLGAAIAAGLGHGPVTGLISGLACALGTGMCTAVLAVLRRHLYMRHWRGKPTQPDERIWRSVEYANVTAIFAALYIGALYGSVLGLAYGPSVGLLTGLAATLVAGSLAWLNIGGMIFLHHFAVRGALARAGVAPRRLSLFLEAMTERQLLRRSGGAYLFVHRMLRDFFAAISSDDPLAADTKVSTGPTTASQRAPR
jgi:NACHT domain